MDFSVKPRIVTRAPALFRLSKGMIRKKVRGGWRLLGLMHRMGLLNVLYRHRLNSKVSVDVPRYSPDDAMNAHDVQCYEPEVVDALATRIGRMPAPVYLIDCGENIGLITARPAALCPGHEGGR